MKKICLHRLAAAVMAAALTVTAPTAVTGSGFATADEASSSGNAAEKKTTVKKKGLVTNRDGSLSYYSGGKKIKNAWKKVNGKKYYFDKNGEAVSGSVLIKKTYYIFKKNCRLATGKEDHFVTVGKKIFCASKTGTAVTGWQKIGKYYYYMNKKGRVVTNKKVDGVKLDKDGKSKKASVKVECKVKAASDVGRITSAGMSSAGKLRACWNYVVGGSFHYASIYPNLRSSGWQYSLALRMLNGKAGNCYGFACAFAALADACGYRAYVCCGRCYGTRDGAADGLTRHACVRINGRYYDPEAQYAGWARGIYASSYSALVGGFSMYAF